MNVCFALFSPRKSQGQHVKASVVSLFSPHKYQGRGIHCMAMWEHTLQSTHLAQPACITCNLKECHLSRMWLLGLQTRRCLWSLDEVKLKVQAGCLVQSWHIINVPSPCFRPLTFGTCS